MCTQATSNQDSEENMQATTEEVSTVQSPLAEGKVLYLSYYIMCHGDDEKGGGPLVENLKQTPPDLTSITLGREAFSKELITKIIAGVENVPGHSTGDMPAWFETFKESEGITEEAALHEKISHIVTYLKSIQMTEWPKEG